MKKFDGILMCTDLDGTLLMDDKSVSKENIEAIEYFKSEGGLFTFVTGRVPMVIGELYRKVHANAPAGCINGGAIYDCNKGEYLYKKPISRDVLELVRYIDENVENIGIQINTFETTYFSRDNEKMVQYREDTGAPLITKPYDEVQEEFSKILFGDTDPNKIELVKKLLTEHPGSSKYDLIRTEIGLYEILPKNTSKGTVLEKMTELLGIDIKKTVALGDYNNDIDMLRVAGIGIAVANAVPEVKAVADHITVGNNDHAIAKTVEEIEKGILTFA